ncbi:MAG: BMC domain-containing protein [Bacillota bacterium]
MRQLALGLFETMGFTAAFSAVDAATKAANVTFLGYERVIGMEKTVSIVAKIEGDVAAVKAAIAAGQAAGNKTGKVFAVHVIPSPHEELKQLVMSPETKETISRKSTVNTAPIAKEKNKSKTANKSINNK